VDRHSEPVDWGWLTPRLRPGDHTCATHGRMDPVETAIGIPACPHCNEMLLQVRFREGRLHDFVEPAPSVCAGPDRHPLTAGGYLVSWLPCACPAAAANRGGHRAWACRTCETTAVWPPCGLPDA
jgi:hypothetical protein